MKKIKQYLLLFFLFLLSVSVFIFNQDIKTAFKSGIDICINNVLPPLFPMLIISSLISMIDIPKGIKKIIGLPLKLFPGIPDFLIFESIIGSVGGYPVGIKALSQKINENDFSEGKTKILALTVVNPGPAFSVLVTGIDLFGSAKIGEMLYFSVTLSNMIAFCILRIIFNNYSFEIICDKNEKKNLSEALIISVDKAIRNSASITAWIVLFSIIHIVIARMPFYFPFLDIVAEITQGVRYCAEKNNIPLCAFCLSFAGICLYFQLISDLKSLGIRSYEYFSVRLMCGLLSFIIQKIFIIVFPYVLTVDSFPKNEFALHKTDPSGSAALLIFCLFFILNTYNLCNSRKSI